MIIRIHIFNFKKQTNKQTKQEYKQSKRNEKRKENISGKSIKKIAAARVKIFFVTRISGNKIIFLA